MNALAKEADVVLGVSGANLDEIYDTVAALEKAGNKNLIIDATGASLKETYANAVQIRRAALKDQDRTFGYPKRQIYAGSTGFSVHYEIRFYRSC